MSLKEVKNERDKACKDYLDLYARVDKAKDLIKEMMKKEKFKIEKEDFVYMSLEHLGDLKQIYDILERRD